MSPAKLPFEAVAEAIPALVFVTDAHGQNVYVNHRASEFTGLSVGSLMGEGWLQMLHPDDRQRVHGVWTRAVATQEPFEAEYRFRRRDGEYRLFLCRGLPTRNAHGLVEYWVGTCTDIEAHRRAEFLLQLEREQLERTVADRTRALTEAGRQLAEEITRRDAAQTQDLHAQKLEALGALSGSIAHDFNNVLAAISGAVNLLNRAGLSTEHQYFLQFAQRGVERGTHLVRQLVGFARSEPSAPKPFDVAQTLAASRELIKQALGGGMDLVLMAADGLTVLADPQQFELAVLNLAINARDAMAGTGSIQVHASLSRPGDAGHPTSMAQEAVCIAVCDSGAGMPPEILAQATDPFFTTKPRGLGTGLGLPTVRSFAERAQGALTIESKVGQGTQVAIFLPRVTGAAVTHTTEEPLIERERHGHATVLVVEDDPLVRPMLCAYLRDLNYTVVEAQDGLSAYAMAHALPALDALVVDIVLPQMDGPALAERLRAERDLPILFISGQAGQAALFGERVLEKPFSQAAFAEALLRSLGRAEALAERGSRAELDEHIIRIRRRVRDPDMLECLKAWTRHWNKDALPLLGDILRSDQCAAHAFVAQREAGSEPVRYRMVEMGHALSEAADGKLSALVSTASDGPLTSLGRAYERAVQARLPSYEYVKLRDTSMANEEGTLFERLLLPVRTDTSSKHATHVVGIVNVMAVGLHRAQSELRSLQQRHEDGNA